MKHFRIQWTDKSLVIGNQPDEDGAVTLGSKPLCSLPRMPQAQKESIINYLTCDVLAFNIQFLYISKIELAEDFHILYNILILNIHKHLLF